jgi:hypothetical protein
MQTLRHVKPSELENPCLQQAKTAPNFLGENLKQRAGGTLIGYSSTNKYIS